jgi:hypothetical protein
VPLTFTYEEIEKEHLERAFDSDGEFNLRLPRHRGNALISFIKTLNMTNEWREKSTPYLNRLIPMFKGFFVIVQIGIRHSKLMDVGAIVVLRSTTQTWEETIEGVFVFRIAT